MITAPLPPHTGGLGSPPVNHLVSFKLLRANSKEYTVSQQTKYLAPSVTLTLYFVFTHLKIPVQRYSSPFTLFRPRVGGWAGVEGEKEKKKPRKKSMTFNSALLICLDNAAIELCFCQR